MRAATDDPGDEQLAEDERARIVRGGTAGPRAQVAVLVGTQPVEATVVGDRSAWGAVLRAPACPEVRLSGAGYELGALRLRCLPPDEWRPLLGVT
jgi:hypothetical protein